MKKMRKAGVVRSSVRQTEAPGFARHFQPAGKARSRQATNEALKGLRALAAEVIALQEKARALGLFADDRELLECPECGLQEDVAFSGRLITSHPDSADENTGLRFKKLSRDRFRCPACGATVREPEQTETPLTSKGGKRPCRARKKPRS